MAVDTEEDITPELEAALRMLEDQDITHAQAWAIYRSSLRKNDG